MKIKKWDLDAQKNWLTWDIPANCSSLGALTAKARSPFRQTSSAATEDLRLWGQEGGDIIFKYQNHYYNSSGGQQEWYCSSAWLEAVQPHPVPAGGLVHYRETDETQ